MQPVLQSSLASATGQLSVPSPTPQTTAPAAASPCTPPIITPKPTPSPTPVASVAFGKNTVAARQVRNGWGVNGQFDPANQAASLDYLGTRWVRAQFDQGGSPINFVAALQAALVAGHYDDPNLKLQLLLNDYIQNVVNGVDALPWSLQASEILNNILPIKNANGGSVMAAIEGPNEINTSWAGGGAHGPDGAQRTDTDFATSQAAFLAWSKALFNLRVANRQALRGVEILSPTILYYTSDQSEWGSLPNVSQYVDYGTFHYYSGINGTTGVPSFPLNPDNFANYYKLAQGAMAPGVPMVQSEGGASTQTGGGYAQDGRSQARYMLMQILDHFAMGGHRFMIYQLYDGNTGTSYNEENFGIFKSDQITPKPSGITLHNFANLMSLNNNWHDPANLKDTGNFVPTYSGNGFSLSGLQNAGTAGSYLILPKSDGSTMIAVWNEPAIDAGSGTSLTPAANAVTVNFGSNQNYKVYDPTGGGGAADFNAQANLTPIASGTGSSVHFTLYGTPLLIELGKQSQ